MNPEVFENERQNIWACLASLSRETHLHTNEHIAEILELNGGKVELFKTLTSPGNVSGQCFRNRCEMIKMVMFEVSDKLLHRPAHSDTRVPMKHEVVTEHAALADQGSINSCPWKATYRLVSQISRSILIEILDMLAISVGMLTMHPYDDQDEFSVTMATQAYAKDQAWVEVPLQTETWAEQNYLSSMWGFLQYITSNCDCNLCQGKYSPQQGY
ncbi:hypothetical protein N7468_006641 [Penicillium chermesinum]|uniref:Uncharacterized protein n=1 Tax=Penicillium chermesinum TaxID=63820 RepID=A0A9W9NTC6_9EURO|nr:uncharacterized protein N7468_006641 [Penicillium chermesinum]KAJ5225416.1 hypothetical protein N7468_006641 [Penicillium chermesinum]